MNPIKLFTGSKQPSEKELEKITQEVTRYRRAEKRQYRENLLLRRSPERQFFLLTRSAQFPTDPAVLLGRRCRVSTGLRARNNQWKSTYWGVVNGFRVEDSEELILQLSCTFPSGSNEVSYLRKKRIWTIRRFRKMFGEHTYLPIEDVEVSLLT